MVLVIRLFLLAVLLTWPAAAVLPVGVSWEVRTTGSDSNGGGFVFGASGTDRSQADAAFCTSADLTTAGTAATSAACPFSAASVGNLIQITAGGCTAGFYQVVSVAVVTATLDRSAGTASGCTFALGGGLATVADAFANYVSGNTVWIKSGTYTFTAGISLQTILNSSVIAQGYQITHGDFTGVLPLITTATNSVNLFAFNGTSNGLTFINVNFSNTAATRGDGFVASSSGGGNSLLIYRCGLDGFRVGLRGDFAGDFYWGILMIVASEIKNSTVHGIFHDGSTYVLGSNIHDNAAAGFFTDNNGDSETSGNIFVSTIFQANQDGIHWASSGSRKGITAQNCVFYNQSRDGIRSDTGSDSLAVVSSVFDTNAGIGIDITAANTALVAFGLNNAFRNNGADTLNFPNGTGAAFGTINLSVSPFITPGTNFSLNNTAGGGALLRASGFPGTIPNAGSGVLDVGALQSFAPPVPRASAYTQ